MYTKPLCVDLDKSLIKVDLFAESLVKLLVSNPFLIFKCISLYLKGKAYLKEYVAEKININASNLPFNEDVLDLIKKYKGSKQKVILATGSHFIFAKKIADELGFFDDIIATKDGFNCTEKNKLTKIKELLKEEGFDYVGDCRKDIPIWKEATNSYLVSNSKSNGLIKKINFKEVLYNKNEIPKYWAIIKQIRLHQWVKNFLILVPVITSLTFTNGQLLLVSFATVFLFSLIASSVYIINDIIDVDNDRNHHEKKNRPVASGNISIPLCLGIVFVFLTVGIGGSFAVNKYISLSFIAYLALNIIYSFFGKKLPVVDVFFLCFFYLIRIFIGSIATGITLSNWLLGFAFYLFLSLGFLKRYIEVSKYLPIKNGLGRDYGQDDSSFLFTFGSLSAIASSTILALFINEQILKTFYHRPNLLWLVFVIITFALIRMWHKATKNEIESDPVKFVLKDPTSMSLIFLILLIVYLSA